MSCTPPEPQQAQQPEEPQLKRARAVAEAAEADATAASTPSAAAMQAHPEEYEQAYVHRVYDAIAPHFSATRFKAWPRIRDFLESLPPYAFVADVGCGNGKYFASAQRRAVVVDEHDRKSTQQDEEEKRRTVPGHRFVLGMDMNLSLLRLTQRSAADPNFERAGEADATAPNTTATTTPTSSSKKTARKKKKLTAQEVERREEEMPRTDVLQCDARRCPLRPGTFDAAISIAVVHHYVTPQRRQQAVQELLRLVRPQGGQVLLYVWALEGNEQRSKIQQGLDRATGDGLVNWEVNGRFDQQRQSFQRYYHFFRQGELVALCVAAAAELGAEVRIKELFFDKENWCALLERC